MSKHNEQYAQGYRHGVRGISLGVVTGAGLGMLIGYVLGSAALDSAKDSTTKKEQIKAEGFPRGYQIENVDIPTRGKIIRVEKLPGENYQKTVDSTTGIITFKGNFEYEIRPLRSAMPQDPYHSDIRGRTPDNNDYWTAIREGKVTLRVDTASLENKLKK